MRRLVALVMVMMLLCGSCMAEEILFRGIPWGTSIEQVEASLEELGHYYEYDEMCMPYWREENAPYMSVTGVTTYPSGWQGECYTHDDLKVAGYPVYDIQVLCHYGLTEDGVSRDKEDSQFYMAAYVLSVTDIESAYADLRAKLESLYGDGVETVDYGGGTMYSGETVTHYDLTEKETVFNGDNYTSVKLYASYSDLGTEDYLHNSLMIWYGRVDHDLMLTAISDAVENELIVNEALDRSDDISGL